MEGEADVIGMIVEFQNDVDIGKLMFDGKFNGLVVVGEINGVGRGLRPLAESDKIK